MREMKTFTQCIALAEHYLAIGQRDIHLDIDDRDLPWDLVKSVEAGGSYRLNGLASARVTADHKTGLSFRWYFDFEGRDANGTGVNQFDVGKMLAYAALLPANAREQFAVLLNKEVWPAVQKRTDEVRDALRKQEDSLGVLQSIMRSVEKVAA